MHRGTIERHQRNVSARLGRHSRHEEHKEQQGAGCSPPPHTALSSSPPHPGFLSWPPSSSRWSLPSRLCTRASRNTHAFSEPPSTPRPRNFAHDLGRCKTSVAMSSWQPSASPNGYQPVYGAPDPGPAPYYAQTSYAPPPPQPGYGGDSKSPYAGERFKPKKRINDPIFLILFIAQVSRDPLASHNFLQHANMVKDLLPEGLTMGGRHCLVCDIDHNLEQNEPLPEVGIPIKSRLVNAHELHIARF